MVWRNAPLTLYHGTVGSSADDIQANGILLANCLPRRDFGRGFYTATSFSQAATFANDMYRKMRALHVQNSMNPDPRHAAVLVYHADRDMLGRLDSISFVLPSDDWREFVMHCRAGHNHKPNGANYDLVYGPVSTYTYSAWPNYEQLSFHSSGAIAILSPARLMARGRPLI
jgi:hypothetical protein